MRTEALLAEVAAQARAMESTIREMRNAKDAAEERLRDVEARVRERTP